MALRAKFLFSLTAYIGRILVRYKTFFGAASHIYRFTAASPAFRQSRGERIPFSAPRATKAVYGGRVAASFTLSRRITVESRQRLRRPLEAKPQARSASRLRFNRLRHSYATTTHERKPNEVSWKPAQTVDF